MAEAAVLTVGDSLISTQQSTFGGEITKQAWNGGYTRETLAAIGDHLAKFDLVGSRRDLLYWFDNALGAHFLEKWAGATSYAGMVYTLRLVFPRYVLTRSFEGMYNQIAIRYAPDSKTAEADTAFLTDDDSVALYGNKSLIVQAGVYMSSTAAAQYRANLLALLAWPKARLVEVDTGVERGRAKLEVEVRGYGHTLTWRYYQHDNSETSSDVDGEITATLGSPDYVTIGDIATNTLSVPEDTINEDSVVTWDRLKALIAIGGSAGEYMLGGCFQGSEFKYFAVDMGSPKYDQELENRAVAAFDPGSKAVVEPAMVQPGGILFVRDILGGRPVASPLINDPRATFIESVTYNRNGVAIRGSRDDDITWVAALRAAIKNPGQYRGEIKVGDPAKDLAKRAAELAQFGRAL